MSGALQRALGQTGQQEEDKQPETGYVDTSTTPKDKGSGGALQRAFSERSPITQEESQGESSQIPSYENPNVEKTESSYPEWGITKGKSRTVDYGVDMLKGAFRSPFVAVSEGLRFASELDDASKSYLGTLAWEDRGKPGFDIHDLIQFPDYITPSEYRKLKDKYTPEQLRDTSMLFNLSKKIDEGTTAVTGETETTAGGLTEVIGQFVTGYGIVGSITKLGNLGKGYYVKEGMTTAAFFNPDEGLFMNFIEDLAGTDFGLMSDIFAVDEDDTQFEKRVKAFAEGYGMAVAGTKASALIGTVFTAVRGKKIAIEDAKAELEKNGEVSDETVDRINENAEIIKDNGKEVEELIVSARANATTIDKAKGVSKRTQTIIAKQDARESIARENNAKEIDADKSTKKIHNELVEEFEANLSINKGLTRKDADFTPITKAVGGKRVLDTDLLNEAREKALAKKQGMQERVTETGDIYIEEGIIEDTEEIFDKVLKLENIDALTIVAKELKKARPDNWKETKTETFLDVDGKRKSRKVKKTVMENIFEAVTKRGTEDDPLTLAADHPLWDALDKAKLSFEDFTLMHLGSASLAGKILNKYSQIAKKVKPKSVKEQEELDEMLRRQNRTAGWFRRVENIRRGLLVSQIATAARNLESGLIRSPVEAINNVVETATMDLADGKFLSNRALKWKTWQDSFTGMRYVLSTGREAKEFTDLVLGEESTRKFATQMFNTINEIQLSTGRGTGSRFDTITSKLEDFTQFLNKPNQWQDFMLRRATFMGEAQRLFRLRWDMDFIEELQNGRLKDILRDSQDLNPTKGQYTAHELIAEATERALDLTYANAPESPLGKAFANFITQNNLTVIIPFPRFMAKSMELMAENSVGALIPVTRRIYGLTGYGKKQFGEGLTQREHRMIARNATGAMGIMAATMMLGDEDRGEDYKLVPVGDGTVMDVTPLFPLRQFFFLGKIARDYMKAREDVGWFSGGKEAFFNAFDRKEWAETFLGTSFRTGVAGNLVDEAANLFSQTDIENSEWWAKNSGATLGNYLSTFLVPMNQVIDAQRAMGVRGTIYKETGKDPEIVDAGGAFVEGLVKPFRKYDPTGAFVDEESMPVREDPFQEGKEKVAPLAKVLAGINLYTEDSPEGMQLKELGFTKWELSSKSSIPTIRNFENKLIRTYLPQIVRAAEREASVFERMYEQDRVSLSTVGGGKLFGFDTGVSKERYVKNNVRASINRMVDMLRNDERSLSAIPEREKQAQVKAMLSYRRLPSDAKNKAYYRFVERENRSPFDFTDDLINRFHPNFNEYSEEQRKVALDNLKLRDMATLGELGKVSR
jgi:hypothetical protein